MNTQHINLAVHSSRSPVDFDKWSKIISVARKGGRLSTRHAPIMEVDDDGRPVFVLGLDDLPIWSEEHVISHPDYAGDIVLGMDAAGDFYTDLPAKKVFPPKGGEAAEKKMDETGGGHKPHRQPRENMLCPIS